MLNQYIDILRKEFSKQLLESDQHVLGRNLINLILERSMSSAALQYLSEAGDTSSLTQPEEKKDGTNQP